MTNFSWGYRNNRFQRIFRGYYKQELEDARAVVELLIRMKKEIVLNAIDLMQKQIDYKYCRWMRRLRDNNIDGKTALIEMVAICMYYRRERCLIEGPKDYIFALGNRFIRLVPCSEPVSFDIRMAYGRKIKRTYGQLLEDLRFTFERVKRLQKEFYENQKEPLFTIK